MKIIEIARSYYPSVGGLEKFVSDRARIYRDLGFEYQIVTSDYTTEKSTNDYREDNTLRFKQYGKYNIIPKLNKKLPTDCDLVMVNQVGNFLSDFSIKFYHQKKIPIVLTPHLYFHTAKYKLFKDIHAKYILDTLLNNIAKIICFTEYEKQFWLGKVILNETKIDVIPHYFDKDTQLVVENTFKPYILYLGRVSPNKKIDLLLKSYLELNHFPYSLYLTIEPSSISRRLLKTVESNNKIKFVGNISENEKNDYLKECSALILPSEYEAFSIVTLEASAYKKPLLLNDLSIFHETLNGNGVIFFEHNIESIKKSLVLFSRLSRNDLLHMGEENHQNLQKYTYAAVKAKYLKFFEDLFESIH